MSAKDRRRARTLAFQAVFMLDAQDHWDLAPARDLFARAVPVPSEDVRQYAAALTASVLEHRAVIDAWLDRVHPRWQLQRMRAEDRAILRCGAAELWHHTDVPPKAVLNEWIEIAKIFGGDDSPRFINGILDRAAREQGLKPAE